MVKKVTAYEDSKGFIHSSKDQAEAAESKYLGDERVKELVRELKTIAVEFEVLGQSHLSDVLMDIFNDYSYSEDDYDSSYESSY